MGSNGKPLPMEYIKEHSVWFYLIIIAVIVAIDQLLKMLVRSHIAIGGRVIVVDELFDIVNVQNTGAAFSFLSDNPSLVMGITMTIVAIGFYFLFAVKNPVVRMFLAWVLGGASGNLIDRFTFGAVTDFIDIHILPPFNFADIFVTIGTLFLCIMVTAFSRGMRRG